MSHFSVAAEDLATASLLLEHLEFALFADFADAADGTPASAAWSAFAQDTDGISDGSAHAVDALSGALSTASRCYQLADRSAQQAAASA